MDDIIWLVKVIGILLVAWMITGGADKFQREMALKDKAKPAYSQSIKQNPKTYQQTIIVR